MMMMMMRYSNHPIKRASKVFGDSQDHKSPGQFQNIKFTIRRLTNVHINALSISGTTRAINLAVKQISKNNHLAY